MIKTKKWQWSEQEIKKSDIYFHTGSDRKEKQQRTDAENVYFCLVFQNTQTSFEHNFMR